MDNVRENIKEIMKKKKITAYRVAKQASTKPTTLYRKLEGSRKFTLDDIIKLQEILAVDFNTIFEKH